MEESYTQIDRIYLNCHAIVAAPGPSLTEEVVEILRSVKHKYLIVGVGDSYKLIDFLDELYACDDRWWDIHGEKVVSMYPNLRTWAHSKNVKQYGGNQVKTINSKGFSEDSFAIHQGSNSGFQALNLVHSWGCTRILLVGYNMQKVAGRSHFFTDRHPDLNKASPYNNFVEAYNNIQPHIREKIINCTPDSALTAFRKSRLEDEL